MILMITNIVQLVRDISLWKIGVDLLLYKAMTPNKINPILQIESNLSCLKMNNIELRMIQIVGNGKVIHDLSKII